MVNHSARVNLNVKVLDFVQLGGHSRPASCAPHPGQTDHSGSLPRAHPVHHAGPERSNVQFCSATLQHSRAPCQHTIAPPFTVLMYSA